MLENQLGYKVKIDFQALEAFNECNDNEDLQLKLLSKRHIPRGFGELTRDQGYLKLDSVIASSTLLKLD